MVVESVNIFVDIFYPRVSTAEIWYTFFSSTLNAEGNRKNFRSRIIYLARGKLSRNYSFSQVAWKEKEKAARYWRIVGNEIAYAKYTEQTRGENAVAVTFECRSRAVGGLKNFRLRRSVSKSFPRDAQA